MGAIFTFFRRFSFKIPPACRLFPVAINALNRRQAMEPSTFVTLGIAAFIIFYLITIFNRLVTLKNRLKNAFAQIDVQLKRRYDLIPNLVETAKGYIKHERETLKAVVEARNAAMNCLKNVAADPSKIEAMKSLIGAESNLTNALGKLNIVIEAYPELKASQNMRQLHEEITSTENRVSFSRQGFNDAVMEFNTYRQSFPQNILSGFFGFRTDAAMLEFSDKAVIKEVPKVSFT